MDGSIESKQLSALSGSTVGATETGEGSTVYYSSVEEQIEQSKSHWSTLAEFDPDEDDDEEAEVSNVKAFKALQSKWGDHIFHKFNQVDGWTTLQVGEKFAEGGQAELYHAEVKWGDPEMDEWEYVLKVFKKGTFLRQLQSLLPHGLLQFRAEEVENSMSPTPVRIPRFWCEVYRGTLLEDGRFAFLMVKEHFDLRTLIEREMKSRRSKDCGPFSEEDVEFMMYRVALGMDWLHSRDIVHRDLNASNVLVREYKSGYLRMYCCVADWECSVGVVGTGFFRAPEILQALKEQKLREKPEVFSKAVDVYSYGMTCYEILTGKLPFDGHPQNEYDIVLNGQRPEVPKYVPDWTCELLSRCWQSNPAARPAFGEILDLLSRNSVVVRKYEDFLEKTYGKNFRSLHLRRMTNS